MDEPANDRRGRELRVGERVRLGGRDGVLRYLYRNGAAVVRFDRDTSTKAVPLRRLVASLPEAKATVAFRDVEVNATKDGFWHVEAAGRSASAEFLDQAIDLVLPRLTNEEQDSLLIQLLTENAPEPTN